MDALTSFLLTRSDYGSYHRACDWADIAVYFPWEWEAWQDSETNVWAVGIAAACRAADWRIMPADIREGYYRNMAVMAADFVKYMDEQYGITVPLKRITGAQARARVPGFAAHGDSGIHRTDPGADFDWAYFFKCTAQLLNAVSPETPVVKPKPKEWDEMATKTEVEAAAKSGALAALDQAAIPLYGRFKGKTSVNRTLGWAAEHAERNHANSAATHAKLDALLELVAADRNASKEEIAEMLDNSIQATLGDYRLNLERVEGEPA
ncbi:hypothetical protein DXT87_07380 [Arthrobacter sp. AET 35A]|nr:hypothetical protein [Arthrobacter sp. AET 35A]